MCCQKFAQRSEITMYFTENPYQYNFNYFDQKLRERNENFALCVSDDALKRSIKEFHSGDELGGDSKEIMLRCPSGIIMISKSWLVSAVPALTGRDLEVPLYVGLPGTPKEGQVFRNWEDEFPIAQVPPERLPQVC